ncbi:hypothetical protein KKH23_06215 [Patescibacteria group bacterium]|nr:hypothetical protein [Patescibacteria group bacterium]
MENNQQSNNKGRRPKYLTIERFEKFLYNDFFHLRVEARVAIIISAAILGILLYKLG